MCQRVKGTRHFQSCFVRVKFNPLSKEGLSQNNLSPRNSESVPVYAAFIKGKTAPRAAFKKSRT